MFPPANVLPARSEAAEVQSVIGISQRVRMNSKEKKDLGTLGRVALVGIHQMTSFADFWGVANRTLCPVPRRLRAGHYYDGDHHCHRSWHHPGLHLQEVSLFSSWLSLNRATEETQCHFYFFFFFLVFRSMV